MSERLWWTAGTGKPFPDDAEPGLFARSDDAAERKRLERELKATRSRIKEAEERARKAERELQKLEGTAEGAEASATNGSDAEPHQQSRPANGNLDLNHASFEALRATGLSVSQAARLVAQREERGGFRSVDELDDLRGFSRQLLESLKQSADLKHS